MFHYLIHIFMQKKNTQKKEHICFEKYLESRFEILIKVEECCWCARSDNSERIVKMRARNSHCLKILFKSFQSCLMAYPNQLNKQKGKVSILEHRLKAKSTWKEFTMQHIRNSNIICCGLREIDWGGQERLSCKNWIALIAS